MERFQSLAEFLGINEPRPGEALHEEPAPLISLDSVDIGKMDVREFGEVLVNSVEFRKYLVYGLTLGNLPGFTSILGRYLDHLWGKAPDKIELTGKDGNPIETVTEIRRVIVRAESRNLPDFDDERRPQVTTH